MKRTAHPVQELQQLSRTFGEEAARNKLALLEEIDGRRDGSARRIRSFHDTLILQLRRKLEEDPEAPRRIVTEPGHGYRFEL